MKNIIKRLLVVVFGIAILFTTISCDVKKNNEGGDNPSDPIVDPNDSNNPKDPDPVDPNPNQTNQTDPSDDVVDYAASVKLDMSSPTLKTMVTVKTYVDGDTTHFNVPTSILDTGLLKARYLAINTPESTGKIEEYGKTASNFTKSKLMSATSIYIESDSASLNADSTGGRYLVWVWYRTSEDEEYRNLNIEILQNGLAIASNSAQNRYGETCIAAINQAKKQKLNIYSGQQDPNFYYGDAEEITLKELRTNIEHYNGVKVAFEAVVVKDYSETVYVEEYDEELDMYFGMTVYYGFSAAAGVLEALAVGNRVRIVGSVQFYETGGTYQVSGLTYRAMRPKDPGNVQKISEGNEASYALTTPERFTSKIEIEDEENQQTNSYDYAELAMSSSISMNNLVVKSVYTTNNPDSSSNGAMTLTCECDGITISVRTVVLYQDGAKVTADMFEGKTINVKGIIDYFDGQYQIKLYSMNDVTFVE